MKRGLDFILAATGIVVSAPLWVLFAIAVKLEDGGPIFYRQVRVGRNARAFAVLKFRTLHPDADKSVRPWMAPGHEWVTRVGMFLRRTALDELPQILNILKGEMSFVGPRAMPVSEFESFKENVPGLSRRLDVRPGLTGIAQVYGKATRNIRTKLRYDLLYVRKQSFLLDLKLILLSVLITLRGRWEPPRRKHTKSATEHAPAERNIVPPG
ncbi:MAG: sugar transferase [Candidatus Rokuibacteriota bacterium]|nr:MAG: sugar transferase [Candidatus Rokubacteria bacterium]